MKGFIRFVSLFAVMLKLIVYPMEDRIGSILIVVENRTEVAKLNEIISAFSDIIIGRQGIRLRDEGKNIISLVLEGTTDELGALSGKLGKLNGISVKSLLMKNN
jgi:putative iron-only hydrogenase system regulator